MSLASQLEVDEPQLQPVCDYCLDQPQSTATGICTACSRGTCKTCNDSGVVEQMLTEDSTRESPCPSCQDIDEPDADRDDGDSYADSRDDADRYYDNDGR